MFDLTEKQVKFVNDPESLMGATDEEVEVCRKKMQELFKGREGKIIWEVLAGLINVKASKVMSVPEGINAAIGHFSALGGMNALLEYQSALKTLIWGHTGDFMNGVEGENNDN